MALPPFPAARGALEPWVMSEIITLVAGPWSARVTRFGAELSALAVEDWGDILWPAAEPWRRHAPNLFPIVGKLAGDRLNHAGQVHGLGQHGFARDCDFTLVEAGADHCRLRLTDDAETRARYPFAFTLDLVYRLDENGLTVGYEVGNPGHEPLPASVGAHPAFRWPLDPAAAKEDHAILFDKEEAAPVRRLEGGLLSPVRHPSPVAGRRLALSERLFDADALILDAPASRGLVFGTEARAIRFTWEGFSQLGLWMKPGGDWLCIEPWEGYASPLGFDGDFADKPGIFLVAPQGLRRFAYRVEKARG